MKKIAGLQYVKDFSFPSEQGFTGSCGKTQVKGYMRGGSVKGRNTSSKFRMKKGKMDSMDHGVQPARRGRTQQEIEAGGTKRLKPGFKKGGRAYGKKSKAAAAAGALGVAAGALAAAGGAKVRKAGRKAASASARRKASGRGMPKNVKARGGEVCYSQGGVIKKAGAAQ